MSEHIRLMFITNDRELAKFVARHGVDRIFVDLERIGKKERQGHLDTVMSVHTVEDAIHIREQLSGAELLVRLNPWHEQSRAEVERVLTARPEWIMLPMFRTVDEVQRLCDSVAGRSKVTLLVETPEAVNILPQIVQIDGVREIYIGLNDLHLGLGMEFLFEPLANGMVDNMAAIIREAGLPFGFGGLARVGQGELSAEAILAEHIRLGSSSVILARSFHERSNSVQQLLSRLDFPAEIAKLREAEARLRRLSADDLERNRREVAKTVAEIVQRKRQGRAAR